MDSAATNVFTSAWLGDKSLWRVGCMNRWHDKHYLVSTTTIHQSPSALVACLRRDMQSVTRLALNWHSTLAKCTQNEVEMTWSRSVFNGKVLNIKRVQKLYINLFLTENDRHLAYLLIHNFQKWTFWRLEFPEMRANIALAFLMYRAFYSLQNEVCLTAGRWVFTILRTKYMTPAGRRVVVSANDNKTTSIS